MSDINNTTPIDPRLPEYDRLFRGLQGNILKGHGRDFTANIFVQFHVEGPDLRTVLRSLTERFVTSAHEQMRQRDLYVGQAVAMMDGRDDPMFGNLFLTRNTYKKLGFEESLPAWFADVATDPNNPPKNSRFHTGMRAAAEDLGDELDDPIEPLEAAYVNGTIDALLLLANDSDSLLLDVADRLMVELVSSGIASIVAFEVGRVQRNSRNQGIEHFGYADGISQPLFLTTDFEKLRQQGSLDRWDPFAPLSLVLRRDPGTKDDSACGSYYVFRKLEQNVRAFLQAEAELACALELEGDKFSRAGAMIVGRFRDGTPLVLSDVANATASNDFRYDGLLATLQPDSSGPGDRLGLKCPFQGHIRKTNPRQSANALNSTLEDIATQESLDRSRRIVRRGITYGVRSSAELPEGGVGLLFACFQSSITNQFAFMQRNWANTSTFKVPHDGSGDPTGLDPIIGQPRSRPSKPAHHWRREYGGSLQHEPDKLADIFLSRSHPITKSVGDVVTFRGGDFFFAPSLQFLLEK